MSESALKSYFATKLTIHQQRAAIELSHYLKSIYGVYMTMAQIREAEGTGGTMPDSAFEARSYYLEPYKMVLNKRYEYVPIKDKYKTRSVADIFIKCYQRYEVDKDSLIAEYIPPHPIKVRREEVKIMKTCKFRTLANGSDDGCTACYSCGYFLWNKTSRSMALREMGLDPFKVTCMNCPFYEEGEMLRGKPTTPIISDFDARLVFGNHIR